MGFPKVEEFVKYYCTVVAPSKKKYSVTNMYESCISGFPNPEEFINVNANNSTNMSSIIVFIVFFLNLKLEKNIQSLAIRNSRQIIEYFGLVNTEFWEAFESEVKGSSTRKKSFLTLVIKTLIYLNKKNIMEINEAIINEMIYKVYSLNSEDRIQVESKMGESVGSLPVLSEAKRMFLSEINITNEITKEFILSLPETKFKEQQVNIIKEGLITLYQKNSRIEEFSIRHQINPINLWYWFKENKILPQCKAKDITLEFVTDACRTVLLDKQDGIIPLNGLSGELSVKESLENYCQLKGFTSAQFLQLDELLGKSMNSYLENDLFKDLSNYLNLFMYLPKTPFIWHLSSGVNKGFEAFIIIYKWNRDSLYKLKTKYLSKRKEILIYRKIQIGESNSAQSQSEKEIITLQLREIDEFTKKVDELIAEGYNPQLDDGVGKNIAPLQNKGMLKADVLNKKQLEKYLKAEW